MQHIAKMNYHSRSSSETEMTQCTDVLPIFLKDFREDFDFDDLKSQEEQILLKYVSSEQVKRIANETDQFRKVCLLFAVLCKNEKLLEEFLDVISVEYPWLAQKIRDAKDSKDENTTKYLHAVNMLRSTNQRHTEYNVRRLDPYLKLRLAIKKLKPYHIAVLYGGLGIGKKWLAIDVCSEYSVFKSTGFQIIWLDVEKCKSPEEDLNMLMHLYFQLKGFINGCHPQPPTFTEPLSIDNRIIQIQNLIKSLTQKTELKNCLVVLQNIQHKKIIRRFNLGYKLLLITRNESLSGELATKMSTIIELNTGLEEAEFLELFEKYLGRESTLQNACEIYHLSDKSPLLLSIIANSIKQRRQSLMDWIHKLRGLKINEDRKLCLVIKHSLEMLPCDLLSLYATFAIFQHSIPIPIKLLAYLWNCSQSKALDTVRTFIKYSFLNKVRIDDNDYMESAEYDVETDCMVPYIYSSHLKENDKLKERINIRDLHEKVVKYYGVEENLKNRTEVHLFMGQRNLYFYKCIGHHLKAAGQEKLFPELFLDFGFLEQMMRAVRLLNTLGVLNYYQKEITNYDDRLSKLLREICAFLPQVEEKLLESNDTCLLQYASMATGLVHEEAERQIAKFPQRVWFTERGNFHKRRQIVSLQGVAKHVKFLDHDICLIVLSNNNMMVVNTSLDCGHGPVYYTNGDSGDIIEARLFDDNKCILTLDARGKLKVWKIKDRVRQNLTSRRSDYQEVYALQFDKTESTPVSSSKETIQGDFAAFHISERNKSRIELSIAKKDGFIQVLSWSTRDKIFKMPTSIGVKTNIPDIRFVKLIFHDIYVILNAKGNINHYHARDGSLMPPLFEWPEKTMGLLSTEVYTQKQVTNEVKVIFLFKNKVLMATYKKGDKDMLSGEVEKLYGEEQASDERDKSLTCAKLTSDWNYLVIGTERGLIVFDMETKSEILRGNVSESITSVDVFALDDKISKYVIICGAEGKTHLNILALRTSGHDERAITWSHNLEAIGNQPLTNAQLEPEVFLLSNLFEIYYNKSETVLTAVDSKNRIHVVSTTNQSNWRMIIPPYEKNRITAIKNVKSTIFVANDAGFVCDVENSQNRWKLDIPIYRLETIGDKHLIAASTDSMYLINISANHDDCPPFYLQNANRIPFEILSNYILVINNDYFEILNENYKSVLQDFIDEKERFLCDYQNSKLFLVSNSSLWIYDFYETNGNVKYERRTWTLDQVKTYSELSCLKVNKNATFFAIGFRNGDIMVYKMTEKGPFYLFNPKSHYKPIRDMLFSPSNDVLVSCAEQLCFWTLDYMVNNPLTEQTMKRRSSRFASQTSTESQMGREEVDAQPVIENGNGMNNLHINETSEDYGLQSKMIWCGKVGDADKSELLACIKFDGNEAQKVYANPNFTQFNTIDDDGVYYHLILRNVQDDIKNGNYNDANALEIRNPPTSIALPTPPHSNNNLNTDNHNGDGHYDDYDKSPLDLAINGFDDPGQDVPM